MSTAGNRVLQSIALIVDVGLQRIGDQTAEGDPMGLRARVQAAAARRRASILARAVAGDLRDAGALQALHQFCCDQIQAHARAALELDVEVLTATSTLKEIQRALVEGRGPDAGGAKSPTSPERVQ